jgi:peptidylprolyl isomerase domain and WD repeat-containing protein 1
MSAKSDDDSDDDFGPMPAAEEEKGLEEADQPQKKKARTLKFEAVYMDELPSADFYEHSFMHRDVVTHIACSKATEFVITGSQDGHVKFWKKMGDGIEVHTTSIPTYCHLYTHHLYTYLLNPPSLY